MHGLNLKPTLPFMKLYCLKNQLRLSCKNMLENAEGLNNHLM